MAPGSPRHRSLIVVLLLFALAGAHLPLRWIMEDPAAIAWSLTESMVSDAAIPAAVLPSAPAFEVPTEVTGPASSALPRTSPADDFSILRI